MPIKKNTIIFKAFLILFYTQAFGETQPRNVNDLPNNTNIHTRKDPSSQENFSQTVNLETSEQIELLKKRRAELLVQQNSTQHLSSEEITALTMYAAILEQQILDEQNNTDHRVKNVAQNHWSRADILAYAHESKLALQKALLDRLIQTKRNLNSQVHRIRQCIFTPKRQQQTVPAIVATDPVFALAAGAAIIEELAVAGATVATGLYVGSGNHDSKNSSTPAVPTAKTEVPCTNTKTTHTTEINSARIFFVQVM